METIKEILWLKPRPSCNRSMQDIYESLIILEDIPNIFWLIPKGNSNAKEKEAN